MDGDADKENKGRRSRSEVFTTPATANINSYGTEKMSVGTGPGPSTSRISVPRLFRIRRVRKHHTEKKSVFGLVFSRSAGELLVCCSCCTSTSARTRRLDMNAVLALSCPVRLAPAPLRLYSKRICIGRRIGFAQYASPLHFAPTRNLHLQARLCMSKHNAWQRLHVGYGGSKKYPICETGLSSRTQCSRSGAT